MAPTIRYGSAPATTASGSGVSGCSCDRSCSQAKNLMNARRFLVPLVADGAAQHRVPGLQRVEHRALGDLAGDLEFHLTVDAGQRPQVCGQRHPDHVSAPGHGSVCTSTESTAGRSRTIGSQLSPESAEAYTCPPVVPK